MASGDLIVKVADKDTLDRTYANTNAILAAVGEDVRIKGVKRYGMKINKMTAIRRHDAHIFSMRWE